MDLHRAIPFLIIFKISLLFVWGLYGFTISLHPAVEERGGVEFNQTIYEENIHKEFNVSNVNTNSSLTFLTASTNLIKYAKVTVFTFSYTVEKSYEIFFGSYKDNETENKIISFVLEILRISDIVILFYILVILSSKLLSLFGFFK